MIYGVEDEFTTLGVLPIKVRQSAPILSVLPPPVSLAGVRFDNEGVAPNYDAMAALTVDNQSVPDSYYFTASFYFRLGDAFVADQNLVMLGDSSNNQFSTIELIQVGGQGRLEYFATDSTGARYVEFDFLETPITFGVYYHIFMSVDTSQPAGSKICNCLINGHAQTNSGLGYDGDIPFKMSFNGGDFGLPDQSSLISPGANLILDFQHVWIALGQYVDPSNIGSFINPDNTPVNLGPDGSLPTGTPPTYFFQGNAASFPINLGSGEWPHVIGTLTDAP
jgi:hypothetical protein